MNLSKLLVAAALTVAAPLRAQTCTSQSQMQPADRDALAAASLKLATAIQSKDQATVKANTAPDLAASFAGVAEVIASTAPRLESATPQVEQVYLLDASTLKATADAQFFCTLNRSTAEADFSIPPAPARQVCLRHGSL